MKKEGGQEVGECYRKRSTTMAIDVFYSILPSSFLRRISVFAQLMGDKKEMGSDGDRDGEEDEIKVD
jgi:hypothetical protein